MDYLSFLYFLRKAFEQAEEKETKYNAVSFTRKLNKVDFLVDAENYYREVSKGIENAKREIFICGWWISP